MRAEKYFCRAWAGWALCVICLLSACQSMKPAVMVRRAAAFDVVGRILVKYDEQSLSANVRWKHTLETDEMWLMSPTGQIVVQLTQNHQGATLTLADQRQYHGSDIESLTSKGLGWAFPISFLQHWIRGTSLNPLISAPLIGDSSAGSHQFTEQGWTIRCDFDPDPRFQGLARRIQVNALRQSMLVVVDQWRGLPSTESTELNVTTKPE